MLRRSLITALFSLCCFSALPAAAQVAGDWRVYARTTHAGALCVPQVGDEWWYDFSLTQSVNLVSGSAWRANPVAFFGPVNGTNAGSAVSLTIVESFIGQSTTHVLTLTLDATGEVFTGLDNWVWTNGLLSCAGRDTVTGSRRERRFCAADQPGTCPCGNEVALGSVGGCMHGLGSGAVLDEAGYPSISWGSYVVSVSGAVPNQPCMLMRGASRIQLPFKDGILCMGNPTLRLSFAILDPAGAASFPNMLPGPPVLPFTTAHHQVWYRSPGALSVCGQGSNFSDALTVMWLP